jgi:hypothetical protein
MKIHDLPTQPIERIAKPTGQQVADIVAGARRPVIFTDLGEDFRFLRDWTLDFFEQFEEKVPAQKPEADGVNYFVKYFRIPMSDFARRLKAGENLYIGAREIMTQGGVRSDKDGLGQFCDRIKLPSWIDPARIYSSNLWAGAGNNRTLLHYDPWDGVLAIGSGTKDFILFPSSETSKMAQVGSLDFGKLGGGSVLHSKIRPLDVQPEYQQKFATARGGYRGTISAGDVIYIPAGFWHYVESYGVNIGLNFFLHFKDKSLNFKEPLRSYWIKDNITLWPIRWYQAARAFAGNVYHLFVPRKTTA